MQPAVERYATRSIRLLELWRHGDWRLKVYGIAYRGAEPARSLVTAARQIAGSVLQEPATTAGRYGVGFMETHEGRGANLVFVDWWADGNELHHHVFTSTPERPTDLIDATGTGLVACVWDLAVIGFERAARIETVLAAEDPDLDRYMERLLEGDV